MNPLTALQFLFNSEITGTPLEDANITPGIDLISEFLNYCKKTPENDLTKLLHTSKSQVESFGKIKKALEILKDLDAKLFKICSTSLLVKENSNQTPEDILKSRDRRVLKGLEEFVRNALIKLKTEDIFLPGGYIHRGRYLHDKSHTMIYQLSSTISGNIEFSIYNTGDGLTNHTADITFEKIKYNPIYKILIPANQSEKLSAFLVKLLKFKTIWPEDNNYDAQLIYDEISKFIQDTNSSIVHQDNINNFTTGQRSNTPGIKVIKQVLRNHFKDLKYYRLFCTSCSCSC